MLFKEEGMKDSHLQTLLRHPDAIALAIIAMAMLSRVRPPYYLLRFFGLI